MNDAQKSLVTIFFVGACLVGAPLGYGVEHWRHTRVQRVGWANTYTSPTNYNESPGWPTTSTVPIEIGPAQATTGTERTRRLPDGTIVPVLDVPSLNLSPLATAPTVKWQATATAGFYPVPSHYDDLLIQRSATGRSPLDHTLHAQVGGRDVLTLSRDMRTLEIKDPAMRLCIPSLPPNEISLCASVGWWAEFAVPPAAWTVR